MPRSGSQAFNELPLSIIFSSFSFFFLFVTLFLNHHFSSEIPERDSRLIYATTPLDNVTFKSVADRYASRALREEHFFFHIKALGRVSAIYSIAVGGRA